MNFVENEKLELKAFMNMFVAIKKLSTIYSLEQAVDVLDAYFKTNDEKYLPKEKEIRNFIVDSHMRDVIFPLVDGKYAHLMDFVDELCQTNKRRR